MLTRTSAVLAFLAVLAVSALRPALAVVTSDSATILSGMGEFRAFIGSGNWKAVVEGDYKGEWADHYDITLKLGAVGTLWHSDQWALKAGAAVWREFGALHEGESDPAAGGKIDWWGPLSRGETLLSADLTPRYKLSEGWVAELRARYLFGFLGSRSTLALRPGITRSWTDSGGNPSVSVYVQGETFFGLGYRNTQPFEIWGYAGGLFALGSDVLMGPSVSFRHATWDGGGSPKATLNQVLFGLSAILYWEP
ncbi:MAG TPA: hypothetical protein VL588_03490 [Bdellovibrionota bacterium]|nr:hypothetical protein [Bdellovibrionota bacterium]